MNEAERYRRNEVVEIDLVDFMLRILKKWKQGLIFLLVGALIGGCFALVRPIISSFFDKEFSQEDLDEARAEMSEEELTEADRVYSQYLNYFRLEETQLDHINHSLFMQMDPETAVNAQRSYIVTSDQTGLVSTLNDLVFTRQLNEQLAQIVGDPDYAEYAGELVTMTDSTWQNWEEIVISGGTESGNAFVAAQGADEGALNRDKNTAVLTISALAPDEECANRLLDVVEDTLKNVLNQLAQLDAQVSITELDKTVKPDAADEILIMRSSLLSAATDIVTERRKFATDTVSKLDKYQKEYIELLQLRDNVKEPEAKEGRGLIKFTAVGGFLGVFLFLCIIFLPYMLGGVIRTTSETEHLIGSRKLQLIRAQSPVDQNSRKSLFGAEPGVESKEAAAMVAGELISWQNKQAESSTLNLTEGQSKSSSLAGGQEIKQTVSTPFFLAVGDGGDTEAALLRDLTASLPKDVSIVSGDPLSDPKALADMLSSQGLILCVCVDKTKRNTIKTLCQMAADHKVPILGYIVIA